MYLSAAEEMLTDNAIRHMMSVIDRWHFASQQDVNPIVGSRHNGYAVAVMDVLMNLAPADRIEKVTGVDPKKIRKELLAQQDKLESLGMKAAAWLEKKGYTIRDILKKLEKM